MTTSLRPTRAALSAAQLQVVHAPLAGRRFLHGSAGSGKTSAGVERLLYLMEQGVAGNSILILAPQRTLATAYVRALQQPGVVAGGMPVVLTVGGLAQRMLSLFWPLAAEGAGFAHPDHPPLFLTLETAQYYMAHLVRPLLEEGYFDSATIERNRLYSQVLDNLNKAAAVGFDHSQIGERLKSAWGGAPAQLRVYDDAQACANRFRQYCLEHNLLDFSLQLTVFWQHLWPEPLCRQYLQDSFQHLIYDNVEEDIPLAHDLLLEWLPAFHSALLIYDQDAGYRRFLGADPHSALRLGEVCDQQSELAQSFVQAPAVRLLEERLMAVAAQVFAPAEAKPAPSAPSPAALSPALQFVGRRFYPQMLDWTAEQVAWLVREEAVPPGEIAILAPFISDSLRFALSDRLQNLGIPLRSHRPSRSLRDEPVTQCLLTLASLVYTEWGQRRTRFDLAYMFIQAIQGMDLVRAQLLAEAVFHLRNGLPILLPFEEIRPQLQERITYRLGERYDILRRWLEINSQQPPGELDIFLSRLFGELLSQPGFGFHADFAAGEVAANLVESVQKFRWAAGEALAEEGVALGLEYVHMVQDGVIAAQYLRSWQEQTAGAVYLAPAYTFLMSNRPVTYQFWLDAGSRGWFERLYQPLTHPYVLSRRWQSGQVWSSDDEYAAGDDALYRLVLGLLRRCRAGVYLGLSELGEQGYEQRGPLLRVLQRVLRSLGAPGAAP